MIFPLKKYCDKDLAIIFDPGEVSLKQVHEEQMSKKIKFIANNLVYIFKRFVGLVFFLKRNNISHNDLKPENSMFKTYLL